MSRLHDLLIRDDWATSAACAPYDPELWWIEDPRDPGRQMALDICGECPVKRDCLQHALSAPEREGIWGGMIASQRNALRKHAKAVA